MELADADEDAWAACEASDDAFVWASSVADGLAHPAAEVSTEVAR